MRRLLNPKRLRKLYQQIKAVRAGGGPRRIKLKGLSEPRGIFVPSSQVRVEVEARDGSRRELESEVPVPWPYAWGYRLARKLNLPVVSRFDPGRLRFDLKVPGRA
jgi:hypothetical protein